MKYRSLFTLPENPPIVVLRLSPPTVVHLFTTQKKIICVNKRVENLYIYLLIVWLCIDMSSKLVRVPVFMALMVGYFSSYSRHAYYFYLYLFILPRYCLMYTILQIIIYCFLI